jgi:hypothetical protein
VYYKDKTILLSHQFHRLEPVCLQAMEVKTGTLHFAAYSIVSIADPLPKLSALLCKKAAIAGALPNVSKKGFFQGTVILTVSTRPAF